jgi:hypothetical protein
MSMLLFWVVMPCRLAGRYKHFEETLALKMEAVCFSETLVPTYKSTRRHDQKNIFNNVNIVAVPYLREYKPHFFDKNLLSKIGVRLIHGILCPLTTEPATPVLYVMKLLVETASVWDCNLKATAHRCIGIFWLHESSRHHRFPEVGRPWHHWQITVNAATDNQSAANAIANILLSHS